MTSNQSGFCPGDSCLHQLSSIMHKIDKEFDANLSLDARGVFVYLSKTFDRVWQIPKNLNLFIKPSWFNV